MCAGGDGVADSCGGNSGGPIVSTKENVPVLVGVVSWGFKCNVKNYPGIYDDVSKFVDWIRSTTENAQGLQIVSAPNNSPTTAMVMVVETATTTTTTREPAKTTIYTNSCNDIAGNVIYYVPNEIKLQATRCYLVNVNYKEICQYRISKNSDRKVSEKCPKTCCICS